MFSVSSIRGTADQRCRAVLRLLRRNDYHRGSHHADSQCAARPDRDRRALGRLVNPRFGGADLGVVVFVVVTLVLGVSVSVVEVVHMITVLDGLMTTVGAVHVRVIGRIMLAVFFGSCHFAPFFFGASLWMAMPVDWAGRT